MFTVDAVVLCDDIRKEANGKSILIGVYPGDIVIGGFPAWISTSFYVEISHGEGAVGENDIHFEVGLEGKEFAKILAKAKMERAGSAAIEIIGLQMQVDEPSTVILRMKEDSDADWRVIKRKRVVQGSIAGTLLPPALRSALPRNT